MPRALQSDRNADALHFVTLCCHSRNQFLIAHAARDNFQRSIEKMRRWYGMRVYGYVVMPEHVHLLVSEPKRFNLDAAIQSLKRAVAGGSSLDPFWTARHSDVRISSREERIEKIRSMHHNPVARGIVRSQQEWAWSSFRHYLTGEKSPVKIESAWSKSGRQGLRVVVAEGGPIIA